MCYSVLALSII